VLPPIEPEIASDTIDRLFEILMTYFHPYSATDRNLAEVQKRRTEHDPTVLNLKYAWYLTPAEASQIPPDILARLQGDELQPLHGAIVTGDGGTFREVINFLPERIRSQLPSTDTMPTDIGGYSWFVCPLPPDRRYNIAQYQDSDRMVLNGDGMLYRLNFADGRAILKTRMLKTPCYYADLAAQVVPDFDKWGYRFLDGGMVRHSIFLGTRNQMNTAFLATRDHLLLTFDAARPHIFDPDSMELLSPIGGINDWLGLGFQQAPKDAQLFLPYSNPAHPVCDRSEDANEFFTVNFSSGAIVFAYVDRFRRWLKQKLALKGKVLSNAWIGFTDLIRYNFDGSKVDKWRLYLPNGEPVLVEQAVHQMALTKDYIIVGDIAFEIEISQIFAPYVISWVRRVSKRLAKWLTLKFTKLNPPQPFASLYLIDRQTLDSAPIGRDGVRRLTVKKIVLPREVSHFVVDYENPNDIITLYCAHNGSWDVTEWVLEYDRAVPADPQYPHRKQLRKELKGFQPSPLDLNSFGKYEIDGRTAGIVSSSTYNADGKDPSGCNTWSLSVNTHRNIGRDIETETATKITDLYWINWGFSWETISERMYRTYSDRVNRSVPIEAIPNVDKPMTLIRLDTKTLRIADSFEFPIGHLVRSPQFVPSSDPCPEGCNLATHGYIVCIIMSDADPTNPDSAARDEFWVFHADDFKNKPIYRFSHPDISLGMMIHSAWIPNIEENKYSLQQRRDMRQETLDRDYKPIVDAKTDEHVKNLYSQVIEPYYLDQISEPKLLDLLGFDLDKS
jgi:hypothetical protein